MLLRLRFGRNLTLAERVQELQAPSIPDLVHHPLLLEHRRASQLPRRLRRIVIRPSFESNSVPSPSILLTRASGSHLLSTGDGIQHLNHARHETDLTRSRYHYHLSAPRSPDLPSTTGRTAAVIISNSMTSTPLTPAKRLGLGRQGQRPSLQSLQVNSRDVVSPLPTLTPSTSRDMLARKTSYNQLTQNSLASIPDSSAGYGLRQASRSGGPGYGGGGDVEVGDTVNTPGGMYGTVKFIGGVRGKSGVFVGVELEGELAGKGKNDGAVDG